MALFRADASGDSHPLAMIKESAPDTPIGTAIDGLGNVFIGNANGNIKIFAGRNFDYQLMRTLEGEHTRMHRLSGIAVDFSGNIYTTDLGESPAKARVNCFSAALNGNVEPARTISGPHTELSSPISIAIDASGQAYVVDRDSGKVLVFAADAKGDAAPVARIEGVKAPDSIFVDSDLNVYLGSKSNNSVSVLVLDGPQTWSLNATITSAALRNPQGVAADNSGRVAAAVHGAVLFFAAGAHGDATPAVELQGPWPMNPSTLMIR